MYVRMFDPRSKMLIKSFKAHDDSVSTICCAGGNIATGGHDGFIKIW